MIEAIAFGPKTRIEYARKAYSALQKAFDVRVVQMDDLIAIKNRLNEVSTAGIVIQTNDPLSVVSQGPRIFEEREQEAVVKTEKDRFVAFLSGKALGEQELRRLKSQFQNTKFFYPEIQSEEQDTSSVVTNLRGIDSLEKEPVVSKSEKMMWAQFNSNLKEILKAERACRRSFN